MTEDKLASELKRRHQATVLVIRGLFVMTLIFVALAFSGKKFIQFTGGGYVIFVIRITIVIFGLGAVALRRTRFSAMRLQDIAAVEGYSGLLRTLESTSVQVAVVGGAISVLGFVITMFSHDPMDMVYVALAATAVMLYGYPRRESWERVVLGIEQTGDANARSVKGTRD